MRWFGLLVLACCGGCALPGSSPPVIDTQILSHARTAEVDRFWTEEAMAAAVPIEEPEISEVELNRLLSAPSAARASDTPIAQAAPVRADVTAVPYKFAGRLFLTRGGAKRSCSAQFAGNSNVLLTAAHCVRDSNGTWASDLIFVQAYADGKGTRYSVSCMKTARNWVSTDPARHQWDYAFLRTEKSATGSIPISFQLSATTWQAIGYPSNYEMAKFMQRVVGAKGQVGNGVIEMKGNPMRKGNSGGAWIAGSNIVGLNSFHKTGNTTDEWSPNFNHATRTLYDAAVGGC